MAIEIVDFPINSMVIVHSFLYVYQRVGQWEFQDPTDEGTLVPYKTYKTIFCGDIPLHRPEK